jgi:hypothetical protein
LEPILRYTDGLLFLGKRNATEEPGQSKNVFSKHPLREDLKKKKGRKGRNIVGNLNDCCLDVLLFVISDVLQVKRAVRALSECIVDECWG